MTLALALLLSTTALTPLDRAFLEPPREAKPHTWYHLMNGNVTLEGITRDFEALAAAGVGGVQMFDAGCDIPAGPLAFNSPAWFDMFLHAAKEARRLGLEICIPNCSGWSSSGGPWITPDRGMKKLSISTKRVKGPVRFSEALDRERNDNGFYADIAVVAYPTPKAACVDFSQVKTTIAKDGSSFVCESEKPFTCSALSFDCDFNRVWISHATATVATSEDGVAWREVSMSKVQFCCSGGNDRSRRFISLKKAITSRFIRVAFDHFGPNKAAVGLRITSASPEGQQRISNLAAKTFLMRAEVERDSADNDASSVVARDQVRDITEYLSGDTLVWDVPEGDWMIQRVGFIATGRKNHPASRFGSGLEVDKFSAESIGYHIDQYVAKLVDRLGDYAGKVDTGFNNILVDSYEVGSQNWTQGFEKYFMAKRGYSIVPFLPVFTGQVVGSTEISERFLEDFRRVVADLFAESYSKGLADKCHSLGLMFSNEAYGSCPADNLQYGEYADIPMGEFWSSVGQGDFCVNEGNARYASYIAHVWGKRFAATESFTANPSREGAGRWRTTPFGIKAQGDRVMCRGINRFIFHRFTHQPWTRKKYLPGMTMGRWGMHFDRTQTWWPLAGEWLKYLTRCQSMLQQGRFVADALFFCGEQAPNQGGNTDGNAKATMGLPFGYAWDYCSTDAMRELRVVNGRVVVPGGISYAMLVLPPKDAMSVAMLERISDLIDDGAKVCAPVKPTRILGLAGYPQDEERLAELVESVWANGVLACEPAKALERLGVTPDFDVNGVPKSGKDGVAYIHRTDDAGADWFFVAMPNQTNVSFSASFRVTGRIPEIWDAERVTRRKAAIWRQQDGRTSVRLDLPISGSAFVVFREQTTANGSELANANGEGASKSSSIKALDISSDWKVRFPNGCLPNAMAKGADEVVDFPKLLDWKDSANEGVKYFSGIATYEKKVDVTELKDKYVRKETTNQNRVILDLGNVEELCEITVNGHTYPVRWKPPYDADVTDLVASGTLDIRVRVANLWANRLIGDDIQHEDDCKWRKVPKNGAYEFPIAEIPDWVKRGKKSPTGRCTFTTFKHWSKNDPLQPSGILGPASIVVESKAR